MTTKLTIDPITRIEGHLRIDVEVDQGKVQKAWASSTMWRGIERILLGRDPREAWLFTQRFCGVCTTVHALASVRAVEDALDLPIPRNAQYIRNLILIAHAMHDHVVHFYHLSALDWVDVTQVLKADPAKALTIAESLSDWPGNSKNQFVAVQKKIKALVDSGQLGIFAHGYWGHPAMKLPSEINLIAVSHYLQALEYQRYSNQVVAMLGGKTPHIQNVAVGGVSNAINLESEAALNVDRLFQMKSLLEKIISFVQNVYVSDVCAIAGFYPDWFSYGAGVTNYLSVPDLPLDGMNTQFELPGGFIPNGDLSKLVPITGQKDETWRRAVTEDSAHAWYKGGGPLHPWKGETDPEPTEWDEEKKYSWVKAPRYDGQPAQVGPLANVLVGYAQGHPLMKKWTDAALEKISAIAHVKATPAMLHSTLGRHGARAIRAAVLSDLAIKQWQLLTDNILKGDTTIYNKPEFPKGTVQGVGFHE